MNIRYVLRQQGLLYFVLSTVLLAIATWSAISWVQGDEAEQDALTALLISAGAGLGLGAVLLLVTRSTSHRLARREALLLVAMSWLVGAALAGLPYWVWARLATTEVSDHAFRQPINCYFEAMSGLTTTGATVLTGIELMPRSILLWRATTHWLGGLGIVVLFVAVLPSLGVGAKKLFRVEAPGPTPEGVHPHIRETARILWLIYLGLTAAETLALRLAGLDWFNAVCHTFATLATGGFSTTDASVGGYTETLAVDIVVIVFMFLAGVNFGLYYEAMRGRLRNIWRDTEFRVYVGILAVAIAIVTFCISGMPHALTNGKTVEPSVGTALRHAAFTTISLQTTTGFCTADFDRWPFVAKAILVTLMFVGASAGSTGGGMKVIRVVIAFKVMIAELERVFRPTVVRPVKVGKSTISPELRLATLAFVLGYLVLFAAGTGTLMILEPPGEIDITTAATASAATLCNIGPGLAKVGAVENYAWFTAPSKAVMTILMALGRLEVFAILVLIVPRFWRST